MSSSTPSHRFLLDENVRIELSKFLRLQGFDVKVAQSSATDFELAAISTREQRILITNDQDFIYYSAKKVFCVLILRIPQRDKGTLLSSLSRLLKENEHYQARLVILIPDGWRSFPLGKTIVL